MRYLMLFALTVTVLFTVSVLTWKLSGKPTLKRQSTPGAVFAGLLIAGVFAFWLYLIGVAAWAGWKAISS